MSDWPVYTPIILAAGASSRMGRPKALLDFDGISGLELVLNACRRQHVGHPIIVLGCAEREIRQLIPPDATIASNPDFMRGQTSSLRLGLSLLPKESVGFLIFPVDHPLVRSLTIDLLLNHTSPIIIPVCEGRRGHPSLFHRSLAQEFLALADDQPAHTVVRRDPGRVKEIVVDDPGIVLKLNTPDDYDTALELFRKAHTAKRWIE